jgi:hypothetical protein
MAFNQATPAIDNSAMEISSDYNTSVLASKYQLSGFRTNNFMQQPLPLDYLLNTDFSLLANQLNS